MSLTNSEGERLIKLGVERGLVRLPGQGVKVEKNGEVATALGKVESQWVDVTAELAQNWLKNNFRNRPMREDTVKAYARDMINGAWVPTHQGIAFNDQDALIDGQHRLAAIVMSGVTVRLMVTFGLPSKIDGKEMTTMDAVDRGATRSVADQLTIQHGFSNGSITAAICAALSTLCCGERTRRLSVGQTLEVFRAFEHAVTYVIEHRSKQVGLRTTGVLAGFAFALATEDRFWESETKISNFFEQVNLGKGLADGSSMKALREFLTSEESKLFSRSLDRGLAELVLQAIWQELNGKKVAKLEPGLDGRDHFRSLQLERVEKIHALFKLPAKVLPGRGNEEKVKTGVEKLGNQPSPAQRPSLERILMAVEKHFGVARLIMAGKGTAPEVAVPRSLFVNLAMGYQYSPDMIGGLLKRTGGQVLALHIPKAELSERHLKSLATIRGKI